MGIRLLTSGGGGVNIEPASSIATDVTLTVPVTGGEIPLKDGSGTITATSFVGDGSGLTGIAGGFSNMQVFTASGTFTVPAGVTKVKVTVIGGGGGGGGASSSFGQLPSGGGGGGCAIKIASSLLPGSGVSVTVGIGGTAGGAGAAGGTGGTSSFGAICSATGGGGGIQASGAVAVPPASGAGSNGDINLTATKGSTANTGDGRNSPIIAGGGSYANGVIGAPGINYGGGGAGGGAAGNRAGGAGSAGVVIVEY